MRTIADTWHQSASNLLTDLGIIGETTKTLKKADRYGHFDLLESSVHRILYDMNILRVQRIFQFIESCDPDARKRFDMDSTFDIIVLKLKTIPEIFGTQAVIWLWDHNNTRAVFELDVDKEKIQIFEHAMLYKDSRGYWEWRKEIANKNL